MTSYAGVPEGWEHVDSTYGSHSRMGLNKLASTMEMMDRGYRYQVFNVGWSNAPPSKLNFRLFRRKKE
jgi:hypothetical protein